MRVMNIDGRYLPAYWRPIVDLPTFFRGRSGTSWRRLVDRLRSDFGSGSSAGKRPRTPVSRSSVSRSATTSRTLSIMS